jgi:predicted transcriptional regulator
LIIPCEVVVKTVSPAIRALLAQKLINEYHLKETRVAELLGITQSAVSKYTKKVRGTTIHLDQISEIQEIVNQMTALLLADPVEETKIILLFCQACTIIRSKGLMCPLCRQNQKPLNHSCNFCQNP